MSPQRMQVSFPDAKLADLRERLGRVNWPADFANDDWSYGTNRAALEEFTRYWREEYDWRAEEREINRYEHYRTELDGIPIHFLHARSHCPDPRPIVLTHGWPWTFWDFRYVIDPLVDPAAHGGDPSEAFDVVVPSLPGFCLSTPLTTPGINWWKTADLWVRLMRDELGYERFGAHGGDWGALVTTQLGHKYPDVVTGIHLSMAARMPVFSGDRPWSLTGAFEIDDPALREAMARWEKRFAAHVAVQVLDPQTLAYAMHDSPVALLAWFLGRRRAWSDCDGDVEKSYTREHLLTTVMLYWMTDSFVTSARYYHEAAAVPWTPAHDRSPVVEVPSGISLFEQDMPPGPTDWIGEYFNQVLLRQHSHGGHFAPAEEPAAIVEDIRETFRGLR